MKLKKDFNGSDRETRATLQSNFQIIEDYFNNELNSYNNRISKLEQNSATHEEVTQVSQEWHDRASHISRGTDIPTTRAVVLRILAEIGQVDLSKLPELDDDVVTKKEFDELISTLNQNGDNVSATDPDLYSWLENYVGGV
ncbi:hypothetical protein LMB76_03975 [Limosilactobacillus reuteri]|uniref:Uncharacterized protein n=1 Tax=Limosilactobacillus reuteri TaxID=1598 RepID=A0AAW4X4S5_LIMRT|nr:hypothetical protein [Limosilactobacillus reuteri]MCC4477376.1 hypothetical protein [Limosilactobacillus reuteri]MCC4479652.1 hypothetical protein [Limosilactobacillus reuteri]MCC4489042.1 hypothetical protein [Limosilactobacillus reuteri]MCC4493259.1 hypothetical protein [Limosilactobacillus reuteri]MCC4496069.1 hypothetical protein [Limosilactobacillus reuteri]